MRKLIFLAVLLLAACRQSGKPPVIIISIDTLRSDHLPAYGYRNVRTPAIDRLAGDGIVFENAWAHAPLTLPSHATVMTGLLPPVHGVRDNAGFRLAPDVPTIATLLRASGYSTGGAVSAWVLRGDTGISSGFDTWDDGITFIHGAPTGNLQRRGAETVRVARRWLESLQPDAPFFLFAHIFEPHTPYEPTYDADIKNADAAVSELLSSLDARGVYDDALIILLSDHGEGLGDHGEAEHGVLLYREALQVPLIVKLPKNARRGTRAGELVQLVDVMPTVAAVAGFEPPKRSPGVSLLAPATGRTAYAETLYPRLHLGWSELRSVVKWPHHLIDGPKPELYDTAADRAEKRDIRATARRAYADLRQHLEQFPVTPPRPVPVGDEEAKRLAALGYVSGGASSSSNLNPRDHLRDLEELRNVSQLTSSGNHAAAAGRMEQLLARNPGWSDLRNDLGEAYERMGDLASAERVYRDAILRTPELGAEFALPLARVLLAQGNRAEAEQHARVALHSNAPPAHELLGEIALHRGDAAAALAEAEAMREAQAFDLQADFLTARALSAQRRFREAVPLLQSVLQRCTERKVPLPPRFFYVTGEAFAQLGFPDQARDAFQRQVSADPTDRDAWIGLALVQRITGDTAASKATLREMTVRNPDGETRQMASDRAKEWFGEELTR